MSESTSGHGMLRPRGRRIASALLSSAVVLGASFALAPAAYAAPTAAITIDADDAAAEGETVAVTIAATGVADLYAYDLVFTFDPDLFEFVDDSAVGPDGGFTSGVVEDGMITFTHTRLGTSPALVSDPATSPIELITFDLLALDGGDAVISLAEVRLVGAAGDVTTRPGGVSAAVELTALPDPPVTEPSPTPSVTTTPLPISGSGPSQPLANTGADATPWVLGGAVGIALLAAGTVLFLARRRAVSE
jgi:LPXTG-motif cell wall-anchored protein